MKWAFSSEPTAFRLRGLANDVDDTDAWKDAACSHLQEAADVIDRLTAENNRLNEAYALALAELETLRD